MSLFDLSARLADLFDHKLTKVEQDEAKQVHERLIQSLQSAYPDSQRAGLRRMRAETEAKALAKTEAARPPKPLTGAAGLLQTLDEFKAKNGGVDDPYYAAMRSALEELEIEEREEVREERSGIS